MRFTIEDIRKIINEHPYYQLQGDDLVEHRVLLDSLTPEEQKLLATNMVDECPYEKLRKYAREIEGIHHPAGKIEGFYGVIKRAHEVKSSLMALMDPQLSVPATFLLNSGLDEKFITFETLAKLVLNEKKNEITNSTIIAERLALTTPVEVRSNVMQKLKNIFPSTTFYYETQSAFTLVRNIDRFLLGDNPANFFTDRDYNSDLCHQFINVLITKITGNEQAIGEKLALISDKDALSNISRELSNLNDKAYDTENPFRKIQEFMSASKENVVRDSADNKQTPAVTNPGNNPNGFYTMAKDNFEAVNLNEEEDNTDSNNNNPEMENTESTKQTGKGCFKFCSLL